MALTESVLALDTGSPLVSVAVGRAGREPIVRAAAGERSSGHLLALLAAALGEAGLEPADLAGIVALAGPGSFTGLRVGLATALGLHQALGVPATAVPTLPVLARAAGAPEGAVVAAVDALRGDWCAQRFLDGAPCGEPELLAADELAQRALGGRVIGFGAARLAELPGWPREARVVEPGPLAPYALSDTDGTRWDPALLTAPVYARPPAATPLPGPRR